MKPRLIPVAVCDDRGPIPAHVTVHPAMLYSPSGGAPVVALTLALEMGGGERFPLLTFPVDQLPELLAAFADAEVARESGEVNHKIIGTPA